jgi:ribosomal protein S18 acetylase RimI-like enzyme
MRRAFTSAAEMGVARLSLAVDASNAPALKLYYRFGMARLGSKVAMMRKLA